MEKNQYLRASQLNEEIEHNEESSKELTSWLESERFEGIAIYFVNEEGEHRTFGVQFDPDLSRDIVEYARRRVNQVLRKQNQEFKKIIIMATKIKVSTEIEKGLETVNPGDVVKSIKYDGIVLVVRLTEGGRFFDGVVLDKGNYDDHEVNEFGSDFVVKNFEPFIGTITLECE